MHPRLALARIGPRWRLAAALGCLLLAGVSALDGHAVPPRPGHLVVVAARDLPAGRALAVSDLATVRRVDSWPGTLASTRSLAGRRLAVALRRGEPVSAQRLLSPGLTRGLPAGTVALPVDLATDVRGLAEPGGRVDLLATGTDPDTVAGGDTDAGAAVGRAERVAGNLLVLAALPPDEGAAGGCRLVLAVARETAVKVAGLRSLRLFQAVTLPP